MRLWERLGVAPGITAVIGSGGKTTLLEALGRELAKEGHHVLLCTTTKMYSFPGLPCARSSAELEALRQTRPLLCAGTPVKGTGKLTAPDQPFRDLQNRFDYVLAEADGAAGRPLKAHASWEPVIPPETGTLIHVLGASGFGRPIAEAVHRPELYARLAGVPEAAPATAETEAAVLRAEGYLGGVLFMNQAEKQEDRETGRVLSRLLARPIWAGSLREGSCVEC